MFPSSSLSTGRSVTWRFALLAAVALGLFSLCAGVMVAASGAASQAPEITVDAERTMQGAKLAIRGRNWPARGTVTITATRPPGATADLELGTAPVNANGEFRATKLSKCTTSNEADGKAQVTITVRSGDAQAEQRIEAAPWVCMSGQGAD